MPEDPQPRSIVEVYRRAWTGSDVETAMASVVDDVSYRTPDADLHGRNEYEQFTDGSAPRLTGPVDVVSPADENWVVLSYFPQVTMINIMSAAECLIVEGGKIIDSMLIFGRLSFAPPVDEV